MAKSNQFVGADAWVKAAGMLLTFVSLRAAFHSIQQHEKGPGEHVLLLRAINNKLARIAPEPESISDLDYNEIL